MGFFGLCWKAAGATVKQYEYPDNDLSHITTFRTPSRS